VGGGGEEASLTLVVSFLMMIMIVVREPGSLPLGRAADQFLERDFPPLAEIEVLADGFEGLGVFGQLALGLDDALQQSGSARLERLGGLADLLQDGQLVKGVLGWRRWEDPLEGEVALGEIIVLAEMGSFRLRDVQSGITNNNKNKNISITKIRIIDVQIFVRRDEKWRKFFGGGDAHSFMTLSTLSFQK